MDNYRKRLILRYMLIICITLITLSSCSPSSIEEVPGNEIRKKFKHITGLDLPGKAENMRAMYHIQRELFEIFVKFETDSEGITWANQTFAPPDVKTDMVKSEYFIERVSQNAKIFDGDPSEWQEYLGIKLFDDESFKSGLLITYRDQSSNVRKLGYVVDYRVFIDDQNNIVYILAQKRL
ncbi:MAG: hypothetical protein JW715_12000 [Sedimentisphaerales bacterium]|nr:hypothetical protein [Sedimentisphaerales bacterium]